MHSFEIFGLNLLRCGACGGTFWNSTVLFGDLRPQTLENLESCQKQGDQTAFSISTESHRSIIKAGGLIYFHSMQNRPTQPEENPYFSCQEAHNSGVLHDDAGATWVPRRVGRVMGPVHRRSTTGSQRQVGLRGLQLVCFLAHWSGLQDRAALFGFTLSTLFSWDTVEKA